MEKEELKRLVCKEIDRQREKIFEIGDDIFAHPELGFKEIRTSKIVCDFFDNIGISYTDGLAITGVKGRLKQTDEDGGINVAIMGEMDAVVCPLHPCADPKTGAAHACGHNGQIACMLASAIGLKLSGAENYLGGNIYFMAVPAEECVELEWRTQQIKNGRLSYLGGKQELIHTGAYDNIDMAMQVHGMEDRDANIVNINSGSVGFVTKKVKFIGREAHAGLCPEDGANALNSASLALMAINSMRETFKDQDFIRVHPIITKGGDLVNIVPADVRMETYVRGRSIESIKDANDKVNRAIRGCAYAMGVEVEIDDVPGYLPVVQNEEMSEIFKNNAFDLFPDAIMETEKIGGASSDIGDIATIMPTIQPSIGGFSGGFHSKGLSVVNKEKAYIIPAKAMAMTAIDLLWDDCGVARDICKRFSGISSEEYDNLWNRLLDSK